MTADQALEALVDHHTAWVKAYAHFPAKVVVQNGDLTVDVEPDSSYLPGLSALPLRTFIPGAVVKVQPGTRVHVVFEQGDRALPVAVPVFEKDAGGLNELEVHAAVKASTVAPDVRLGSTAAPHPLVLGDANQTLEATYDTALEAAATALTAAVGAATSAFSAITGAPAPTIGDGKACASACAALNTALGTFTAALTAAATARTSGRAATLSTTSKTV